MRRTQISLMLALVIGCLLQPGCQSTPVSEKKPPASDVRFGSSELVLPINQENPSLRQANSPQCLTFWERLSATTNFAGAVEGHFQMPPECEKTTANLVGAALTSSVKACLVATGDKDEFTPDCLMKLTLYRLSLIDRLSAEMENYEKASSELLFNRFTLRYFVPLLIQDRGADFQLTDQQKILDILKVRFPKSYNVAKAQVVLSLTQWTMSKRDTKDFELASLESSVTVALGLNSNDEEVQEVLWLTMMQRNQRSALSQSITQYMAKHPDSKVGRYYQAGEAWNLQDREQCRSILQKLATQFPDDKRIKETLAALKTAKVGDKIFSVSTSLTFN